MVETTNETPARLGTRRRFGLAVALVAAALAGAGATALAQKRHAVTLVALEPAPVAALADGKDGAVKAAVTDVFGNKFVVGDDSGKALVETGPAGEGSALVGKGETVTVQGRFQRGVLHAAAITHADGHADTLDPPPPPPPHAPDRGALDRGALERGPAAP